ncbi:MAG: efflux RND transporter periplasmic adaptor subunit [Erysipelotrichaceae bacterium]|nr:efflux RND transporter periplasmic adaptor subunit [Erysipelotrichaceae bacterium]MDD4642792.1 efflux RND transporter periplasmic adaptor subunit [Erysipelotrichaceae bacterium]
MKNKKKIIWIFVSIALVIILIFAYIRIKNFISTYQDEMIQRRNEAIFEDDDTDLEIKNEIVFTGKVAPANTQNVYYNVKTNIKEIHVVQGQDVLKEDSLLTYHGAETIDDQITIQNAKFVSLKEDRDWYNYRIEELKQELEWADPVNDGYVTSLKKEIARYQTLLATNQINWSNAVNEIERLKNSYDDYYIKADFDGFVYKIDETAKNNVSLPYMILYSNDRIVTVEVSEYELQYIDVGTQAKITVEGLNKEYTGEITKIDIMPNNMTSNDTSYFNIEVTIPSEVPYGYSVVIAVKIS